MDLLDRLLGHDASTTGALLSIASGLADAELDRQFDVGPGTVRKTLSHIVRNVEVWTDLMQDADPRPIAGDAGSPRDMQRRLEVASGELARLARDVGANDRWDETWLDRLDDPPREKTFGGAIAHVLTHSMHHRAQVIHMLRRLGVASVPEGDVLGWERSLGDGA